MHPLVILFDIDGTLLTVRPSFKRPLIRSILNELGINYPGLENDSFSGRTDHDIMNSFLVNHEFSEKLYQQLKTEYIRKTVQQLSHEHVIRLPYIDEAIRYFDSLGSYIGLLTGNYPETAYAKLSAAHIDYSFRFGVFGEFDKNRNNLPEIALKQVQKNLNIEPEPDKFIIIGDTPRDIECARAAGMKSVAVATGRFTPEELLKENPDLLLNDLSGPERWALLLAETAAG